MNGAAYEIGFLHHSKEVPDGWSEVAGLEGTHHGHHARMIRRDRPDVKPFRYWAVFWRIGLWQSVDVEPFRWACYGAMPSIEDGREAEYLIGALIDAPSQLDAMQALTDRFGHYSPVYFAPKPDGWEPQSAKQLPAHAQ